MCGQFLVGLGQRCYVQMGRGTRIQLKYTRDFYLALH